jgi:hypothetical protein
MTHLLPLLSTIGCLAMMFGGGTLLRRMTRTPLGRWRGLRTRSARGGDPDSNRHDSGANGKGLDPTAGVAIRCIARDDDGRLAALAALDSQHLAEGPWLVAEAEGRALAALSLPTGVFVADPFSRTAELRALLGLRANQVRPRDRGRWRLHERSPRAERAAPLPSTSPATLAHSAGRPRS